MRYQFFFLLVLAFLILIPSQDILASGSATVTRGDAMPPITWTVGGAPGCSTDTSYSSLLTDTIYTQWRSFSPGTGTGLFSFTPGTRVYAPAGSYTFSCTAGATTSTTTLNVLDCPGGTTWNATTNVCEALVSTASLTISPASIIAGGTFTMTGSGGGSATNCQIRYTFNGNPTAQDPYSNFGVSNTWSNVGLPIPATAGTYVFTNICYTGANQTGVASAPAQQTLTVTAPPVPTLSLSATPASLAFGGGITRVTWATTGATSCDAWNGDASWDAYSPSHLGGFSDRNIGTTTTFTMECWNSAGVTSGVRNVVVTVAPAPSATVSASPSSCTIPANQSTCTVPLTWNISNATAPNLYNLTRNVTYSNSASGNNVASAITYGNNTIQARDGASVLSLVVASGSCAGGTTWDGTKCALDPTLTFSASPLGLPAGGGNTTLTWTPTGATWCWSTNWNGGSAWVTSADGTWNSVQNIASSRTFQLQCGNTLTGRSTGVMTVTVTVAASIPDATVSMFASPNPINEGDSTTLTWVTTNANTCWGSGGNPAWDGWKNPAGGSQGVTPSVPSLPYSIECWNATGGSVGPWSVLVNVIPAGPPANVNINALPPSVFSGNPTTLSWIANNATSCWASGGWTGWKNNISGSESVTPAVTTTYTIQCWNSIGQSMGPRSFVVNVMASPSADVVLNATPPMITAGDPVDLDWFTINSPTSCTASNGWGGPKNIAGGVETVYPVANTTYTLQCWNAGGSVGPRSVSVLVNPPSASATLSVNPATCTIPQNQGTCTVDFTWNITSAGDPNLHNMTTGNTYSSNPSGNSVAYPITFGLNAIEARDGGIAIMGANVTANGFCAPLDIWDGPTGTCISAGCTQTVFCSDRATEIANTCQGTDYVLTDNCGDNHLCPGTRSCNYNWKEIAP